MTPTSTPRAGVQGPPPVKKRRGTETARDMVLSMLVLLVAVFGLYKLNSGSDPVPAVKVIDPTADLRVARGAAAYPLAVALTLPGWRPTSFSTATPKTGELSVHEGWVTPGNHYAALEQSDGDSELFRNALGLQNATPGPVVTVDGRDWTELDGPNGLLSYGWLHDGAVVIVTGGATQAELMTLMADVSTDPF